MSRRDWACLLALPLTITVIIGVIVAVALFYLRVFLGALAMAATSM